MKTSEQIHRASDPADIIMWREGKSPIFDKDAAILLALNTVEATGAFTKDKDVRACTEGKAHFITVWIACGQSVWMVHTNTDTSEAYIKSYQP